MRNTPRPTHQRHALIALIGQEIVRFQDATHAFDQAAADVLDLAQDDLQCVSTLLFAGAMPRDALAAALTLKSRSVRFRSMIDRIELAGYARRVLLSAGERIEITDHARQWIQTIWGPLAMESTRLLSAESTQRLTVLASMLALMRPLQEQHTARLRGLLDVAAAPNRRRGGLSPAALQRVQMFVHANLAADLSLNELAARAGLTEFHFARAFKVSMEMTPRAYVEACRIDAARKLLRDSTLPLAQIAADCGLGSQSHFTTTFRRSVGATPAAYRGGDARS